MADPRTVETHSLSRPSEAESPTMPRADSGADNQPGSSASVAGPGPAQRYSVQRLHARGGLGEVYLASDTELHRTVALKRIQDRRIDNPASKRRFLVEAEITARLEHPGIVPVYGLIQDEHGYPCYAMRFIEGESLAVAIRKFHQGSSAGDADSANGESKHSGKSLLSADRFSSLTFRSLLQRFIAVCNTVAYAHSRRIIHRDLKPHNIMLGKYGETLVVDWGLAKDLTAPPARSATEFESHPAAATTDYEPKDNPEATQLGQALGTPEYMSPEQAAGRWDVLDHSSDIYSLGATLYHLLTGEPPISGSHSLEKRQRALQADFPSPSQVNPRVPRAGGHLSEGDGTQAGASLPDGARLCRRRGTLAGG